MHISTSECLGSLAGNWLGTSTSFKTAKQVGTGIVQGWKINKLKPSTCQLLVYPMIQGPVRHVGQHYPMIQNPEHAQQSRIAAPVCTTVTEIVGHNIQLTSNCQKKSSKIQIRRSFFRPRMPQQGRTGPGPVLQIRQQRRHGRRLRQGRHGRARWDAVAQGREIKGTLPLAAWDSNPLWSLMLIWMQFVVMILV